MIAKDIKNGMVLVYGDAPCIIETISVQSPSARGAATLYKYRARNLVTKQKIDIVLKGGESLPEADFERRPVKLMYADATHMHFLDQQDFNQYALTLEEVAGEAPYLTEALEGVQALIYNDECVGLQLPMSVELQGHPVRPRRAWQLGHQPQQARQAGDGARSCRCRSTLSQGETIKVDTRTGEFLSRA